MLVTAGSNNLIAMMMLTRGEMIQDSGFRFNFDY